MIQLKNQLDLIGLSNLGLFNNIAILLFVLNQNESGKNSSSNAFKSPIENNPIENLTWLSLLVQLGILLIKMKTRDF
jgi:hypothetical protein